MTAAPYVLARTMADAHRFGREELGLQYGQYRIVNSSGTLKSVRNVDLYLVPGWRQRFDRFAMQSAIRWTHMHVIDVEEQAEEPSEVVESEWVSITEDEAEAFLGSNPPDDVDAPLDQPGPQQPDDAFDEKRAEAPAEPDKRRRRRCKECGVLVEPDEVESHAASHEES